MTTYAANQGVWTLFARLLGESQGYVYAEAISGIIVFVAGIALWRGGGRDLPLDFSLVIATLLLVWPISWLSLQGMLMVPFAVLLRDLYFDGRQHFRLSHAAVIASYCLLNLQAAIWQRFEALPWIGSLGTYGITLLFLVLVWQVAQVRTLPAHQVRASS